MNPGGYGACTDRWQERSGLLEDAEALSVMTC